MAKRIRIALIAAAMTLLLAMGAAAVNVHAAEGDATTTTPTPQTELKIKKIANVADGVSVSSTASFSMKLTNNADGVTTPTNAPKSITVNDLDFTQANKDAGSAATETVDLSSLTNPGEYTYTLTETAPTGNGWAMDNSVYTVQILVKNDTNKTKEIYITKAGTTGKQPNCTFTNTYTEYDGTLTISKTVKGDYADKANSSFHYTLTLTNVAPNDEATVTLKQSDKDDQVKTLPKNGSVSFEFDLKDNGSVSLSGLPLGATYTVKEDGSNNYTPSVSIYGGNAQTGTKGEALTTASTTIATKDNNTAAFTNTYENITVTGVITQIAPFIAMVAIAGGAVALYIVSRRRRDA